MGAIEKMSLWELRVTCLKSENAFLPRPVCIGAGKRRVGSLGKRGPVGKALGTRRTLRCLMGRGLKNLLMEAVGGGLGPWTGVEEERQDLRVPQM